ncbi:MAG: response regulator [bacterium]|nr:response regulator [bacterium]
MTKIAIIEDDAAISQMYRIKFEGDGFKVDTAENGFLGLQLVENMKPDIVLLDLMMPEMNGDEVLKRLRATSLGKDLKVVILTNMGESEAPDTIKNLGVSAFIVKANMTPRQVVELIKKILSE